MVLANPTSSNSRFPIENLLHESVFPHPVSRLRIIETHISWVILTGEFAYKIKKPVTFDFVDYSTLEKRFQHCKNELQLNRRYSKGIYLDVVPIYNINDHFSVGESGLDENKTVENQPEEYAVKMREFGQDQIAARLLASGKLNVDLIDDFAKSMAEFHAQEPSVIPASIDDELDKIYSEIKDNFRVLDGPLQHTAQFEQLQRLEHWTENEFNGLQDQIVRRMNEGFVKKCHGDLHLQNVLIHQGALEPFDGIEFNEHLQNIDTLNEIAFFFMDLIAHQRSDLGWRFVNKYLEETGGYRYLDLIRFFAVYRAMVRAKVAWIHSQISSEKSNFTNSPASPAGNQAGDSTGKKSNVEYGKQTVHHTWDRYLDTATNLIETQTPRLAITFGFSGSGKSTRAIENIQKYGGIRIRSDIVRQKLKQELKPSLLYSDLNTDRVYRQLLDDAESVLRSGISVVVDATFLSYNHRTWFERLAVELDADFEIIACDASFTELCERIKNRTNDPSEATIAVLQWQFEQFDPLTDEEKQLVAQTTLNGEGSNSGSVNSQSEN